MDTNESVKRKLKHLGIDETSLKKNLVNYLEQIESVLSSKRERRRQLEEELDNCDYDVKSIAQETGISRTTFYSYDKLLQKYVELSHEEDYKNDPYLQIKNLKKTIKRLQDDISLMSERDCKELLLKKENDRLKQLNLDKDRTIAELRRKLIKANN